MELYTYRAVVDKIVDGDTIKVTLDLGFTVYWKSSCRFYGINTPEIRSKNIEEKAKAIQAKEYVIGCLPLGTEIIVHSRTLDKYGRPLVDIYYGENFSKHLNQELLNEGLAKPFMV